MDALAHALGAEFPHRLEAPHCANARQQLLVSAIAKGPGATLLGTYKSTNTFTYQDDLGSVISAHIQVIPGGCLVFVPSYSLLNKLVERWKMTGLWGKMDQLKKIFVENSKQSVKELFTQYSKAANRKKKKKSSSSSSSKSSSSSSNSNSGGSGGALLLCVFRGRFAEGINFSDNLARGIFIIGIPYPNAKDLKLNLIKESLQGKHKSKYIASLAYQAVNQAIGRVIRHKEDYGGVYLLDTRYCEDTGTRALSKWIRPHVNVENINSSVAGTCDFFNRAMVNMNRKNIQPGSKTMPVPVAPVAPAVLVVPVGPVVSVVSAVPMREKENVAKKKKKKKVKKKKVEISEENDDDDFEPEPEKKRRKKMK